MAENEIEIATIMAELNYKSTIIADGKTLLLEIRSAYNVNKIAVDETSAAYADLSSNKSLLKIILLFIARKYKLYSVTIHLQPIS